MRFADWSFWAFGIWDLGLGIWDLGVNEDMEGGGRKKLQMFY